MEEELADLNKQVVDCEEKLGKLINRKNDLAQRIKDKKMEILYQKTIEPGRSVEEVYLSDT